jgi:hypothetical protein
MEKKYMTGGVVDINSLVLKEASSVWFLIQTKIKRCNEWWIIFNQSIFLKK